MPQASDLSQLQSKLGFGFQDEALLRAALTHSSHASHAKQSGSTKTTRADNNERLEFLGDRVLGLSICEQLMQTFPEANEGELARRYNRLVRRKMCAEIARTIDLGRFLILSSGEARSGGRAKSTILANAMEAVLGAVFLDGGYREAHGVIARLWQEQLISGGEVPLDAKTALQEWVQGQGFELPVYKDIGRSGPDHEPLFSCEVRVDQVGVGRGEGSSKRAAEQSAAQDLLEKNNVWDG